MKRGLALVLLSLPGCGDLGTVEGAGDLMTSGSGTNGTDGTGGGTTGGPELPEMVEVPGGDGSIFGMCVDDAVPLGGSEEGEECSQLQRLRWFQIDTFSIDVTEVTQADYETCVQDGVCTPPDLQSCGCEGEMELCQPPSYDPADRPDHPVTCVSWEEARAYCTWKGGDLPTGLQWEKAARGTAEQLYSWGSDDPSCDRVVARGFSWCGDEKIGLQRVASRPLDLSQYGTRDMLGNAGEWVHDRFPAARTAPGIDRNYYSAADQVSSVGPGRTAGRTVRGGRAIRSDFTGDLWDTGSTGRDQMVGFRCVVNPVAAVCGNGEVEVPEVCDDGNLINGDGCSDDCQPSGRIEVLAQIPTTVPFEATLDALDMGEEIVVLRAEEFVGGPPDPNSTATLFHLQPHPERGPLEGETLSTATEMGDTATLRGIEALFPGDGPAFVYGMQDEQILVREVALYEDFDDLYPWEVIRDDGDNLPDEATALAMGEDFEVYVGGTAGRGTGVSDGVVTRYSHGQSAPDWEHIWAGGDDAADGVLDIHVDRPKSQPRIYVSGYMSEGGRRRATLAIYDTNGGEVLAPTPVIPADDPANTAQAAPLVTAGTGIDATTYAVYLAISMKGTGLGATSVKWRVLHLDANVLETGDVAAAVVWDVPWEPEGTLDSWPNAINAAIGDTHSGGVILGGAEGPLNGQRPFFTKLARTDGATVWSFEPAGMLRAEGPPYGPVIASMKRTEGSDRIVFTAAHPAGDPSYWGVLQP